MTPRSVGVLFSLAANSLLDGVVSAFSGGALRMDRDGERALGGEVDARLLAELLDASADGSGSDEAWSRLLQLYAEAGALRKAREIAWLRWSQGPSDARTCIQLAKTLKRPEEVCERLSVIHRALQRHPDNESLLRLRAQDLKFLGVTP